MPPPFRSLAADHAESGDSHATFFVAAVVGSIAAHFLLGYFAGETRIDLVRASDAPSLRQRITLREESAMISRVVPPEELPPELRPAETEPLPRPEAVPPDELLPVPDAATSVSALDPPPASGPWADAVAGVEPPAPVAAPDSIVPWQPRERIIEIASRFANDEIAYVPRRVVPDVERVLGAPDVAPPARPPASLEEALGGAGGPVYAPPALPTEDPAPPPAVLSGTEPEVPEAVRADPAPDGQTASAFIVEAPEDVAPAKPIENVLDAGIAVYRPRRDDGFIYFRVEVRRKGADVLPAIPRDVLLAQDASRSISPERLHFCREAILGAISDSLLPTDRFNVLAFNVTNRYAFGPTWRPVTPDNLAEASAFVAGVTPAGNTDIYNAVKGVLDLPIDPHRATIVFLLSDGVATAGDVRRDSQIIGEFSRLNAGNVSVFNVGVSSRSDEYLLSMLSFCNRGGPAAMAADRFHIPDVFENAFRSVGSPVLSDLRFMFDTASGAVVAPHMTENLYLDRPLRLYGRAPIGTRDVTFQARGVNADRKYDMVFSLRLGNPAPGSGEKEIAREWARTRIYDLVADYARAPRPAILDEMNALGAAHDVPVPFRDRFRR